MPAGWSGFQGAVGCAYCQKYALPVDLENPSSFDWDANAVEFGDPGQDFGNLDEDPRFVAEDAGFVRDSIVVGEDDGRQFFSITARSTGATGQANTVLQSTFARRF